MNRKRAFTLIELLVVIAIIAILAAILFPVFAKARERAKQSKSLNNLKQLAIGVTTYAQDWSETFPGWQQNPDGKFAHNVWDEQINGNIKSKDVYNNGDAGFQSWADPQKMRVVTYGINGLLICTPTSFTGSTRSQMVANEAANNPPAALSSSTVSDPAGTILFAELATEQAVSNQFTTWTAPYVDKQVAAGSDQWNSGLKHWIDISPREWVENATPTQNSYSESLNWNTSSGVARDMYGGGGNYAFVDGHVKFMKIGQTVGLGQTVTPATGGNGFVVAPGATAWRVDNILNLWNPTR